jgi:hypothetical protein
VIDVGNDGHVTDVVGVVHDWMLLEMGASDSNTRNCLRPRISSVVKL